MPPKRLTNLPANVFLDHIAPTLKTRNIARLNLATGGKVPGLTQEARKINADRKQAAIATVKKQQHALARRIVTTMKGIRMAFRKKHSTDPKNKAWLNRYSITRSLEGLLGPSLRYNNKYIIEERNEDEDEDENEEWLPGVDYFLRFPGFGGLSIRLHRIPEIYGRGWNLKVWNTAKGWIPTRGIGGKPFYDVDLSVPKQDGKISAIHYPWQEKPHIRAYYMAPLADGTKYAIRAILTPVIKEVISMWNALPAANRAY
jgi:hypothetical protein